MVNRIISVGDDFTLPASVKSTDANLPTASKAAAIALKLDKTEAGTTYAAKDVETTKLDKNEAATTYVRFEDEAGNPLASRHVVIKVSATTGEIIDIVSEV